MGKLSPWLRQIARGQLLPAHSRAGSPSSLSSGADSRSLIAFVKTTDDDTGQALADHDCSSLACYGSLHIARIPLSRLASLSHDRRILRIEASPTGRVLTDSMAVHLNTTQVYAGQGLPQAYTGKGVVMGIVDVGFDLTHPSFYSRDTTRYRIQRFWDQISADTVGSDLPVGRDYQTASQLLTLGHSRDGLDIAHGTHTLGIAAGSGYDSPYRGMAPEADICLVANAVSEDRPFIDPADIFKYSYATDALGFKYIFDYAQAVGKPCVVSFSEGSMQDFWGYDLLYYEFIDSLVGPGRILVAAAGNEGYKTNWIHKRQGQPSAGTFLLGSDSTMMVVLKSADDYTMRLVAYRSPGDTLLLTARQVLSQPDSVLTCSLAGYQLRAEAYTSCYDSREACIDLTITTDGALVGHEPRLSLELLGSEADVEMWRMNGYFFSSQVNPLLADGEKGHSIHSPSSSPSVISVGATSYRDHVINVFGDSMAYWKGSGGLLTEFSSKGPTFDGRVKPDCVAPGNNIISSYNSFYLENHPDASDNRWDVSRFTFQGRTYAWNSNSGTSMSTPAVGGAIALWLQACPTLTPTDVFRLLEQTCRHPEPDIDYPNNLYGYGEIDVYAGLLHLVATAIRDLPQQHTTARITVSNRQLVIQLPAPATSESPLRIYALDGHPVLLTTLPKGTDHHLLSLPPCPSGIYAVRIDNTSTLISIK